MGSFSIWHWLFLLIWLSFIVPVGKIVSKAGYHPAWCLLAFVPLVNFVMLWVFAFSRWPGRAE